MNPVVTPVKDGLVVYALTDEDRKRLSNVKLINGGGEPEEDFIFHRMCIQQTIEMLTQKPEVWEAGKVIKELQKLEKELDKIVGSLSPFGLPRRKEERLERGETELVARTAELRRELASLHLNASPICVSPEINQAMIGLNDRKITPQQRGRLKSLVETIMNTCPVKRTVRQYKTKPDKVEEKQYTQAVGFKEAENRRREILKDIRGLPFNEALKLIEEAAAVYKVTEAGLPGSEGNPIVVVSPKEN